MSACKGKQSSGAPCRREAGTSGLCDRHDPTLARERGRHGGRQRAVRARERNEKVAASLVATAATDLRHALEVAMRGACADGEWATLVSAVRVGLEMVKTVDMERELAELRAALAKVQETQRVRPNYEDIFERHFQSLPVRTKPKRAADDASEESEPPIQ